MMYICLFIFFFVCMYIFFLVESDYAHIHLCNCFTLNLNVELVKCLLLQMEGYYFRIKSALSCHSRLNPKTK